MPNIVNPYMSFAAATPPPVSNGLPYENSLYLDGSNDYLQADINNNNISDFAYMDALGDSLAGWSYEFDFRFHNPGGIYQVRYGRDNNTAYGNSYIQVHSSGSNIVAYLYIFRANSAGGGYSRYRLIVNAEQNHFTGAKSYKCWHRISITKTAGDNSSSAIRMYLNGIETTNLSPYFTNGNTGVPDLDLGTTYRVFRPPHSGGDIAFGAYSFYDRELTPAEINENYDGGARLGGNPDQAEIMNQDVRFTSSASSLKHYIYYDAAVDVNPTITDKVGNIDLKLLNNTFAGTVSRTTPLVPLFEVMPSPERTYINEEQVFVQPTSSIVYWYDDAARTNLIHTGDTYIFTPSALGNYTLYLREVNGTIIQEGDITYEVSNAGFSNYSFEDRADGISSRFYSAPRLPSANFNNGNFTFSTWLVIDDLYGTQNQIGRIFEADNNNYIMLYTGSNATLFYIGVVVAGTTKYYNVNLPLSVWGHNKWQHFAVSIDVATGTLKAYAGGVPRFIKVDTLFQTPMNANADYYYRKQHGFGFIDDSIIYGDVLTDAEVLDIAGGVSNRSVDLSALPTYSQAVEHYTMENDVFTGSNDIIQGVNGFDIPIQNYANNVIRKSTNRP